MSISQNITQKTTLRLPVVHDTPGVSTQTFVRDVALHALLKNAQLQPEEVNLSLDHEGNVLIHIYKSLLHTASRQPQEKRVIQLPRQEAYQQIIDATDKRAYLLQDLYEEAHHTCHYWHQRCFVLACVESILVTLLILLPALFALAHLSHLLVPSGLILGMLNIVSAALTIWTVQQYRQTRAHVELYQANLTELESFAQMALFLSTIPQDDAQQHLLQQALLSHALTIEKQV